MSPQDYAKKYLDDIKKALKQFGEYTFQDKGPEEVMDIDGITDELGVLSICEVEEILRLVLVGDEDHASRFISSCLVHMQDWDRFDELMDNYDWLSEHF